MRKLLHHVRGRPAARQETLTRRTCSHEMLANGKYSAWFRTPNGDGTAIVMLSDGTITGGDNFFQNSGPYEQNGDRLTATERTSRACDEPSSVFGIDEVNWPRANGQMKKAKRKTKSPRDRASPPPGREQRKGPERRSGPFLRIVGVHPPYAAEAFLLTPLRSATLLSLVFAAFSSLRFVVNSRTTSSWPSSSAQAIRVP